MSEESLSSQQAGSSDDVLQTQDNHLELKVTDSDSAPNIARRSRYMPDDDPVATPAQAQPKGSSWRATLLIVSGIGLLATLAFVVALHAMDCYFVSIGFFESGTKINGVLYHTDPSFTWIAFFAGIAVYMCVTAFALWTFPAHRIAGRLLKITVFS